MLTAKVPLAISVSVMLLLASCAPGPFIPVLEPIASEYDLIKTDLSSAQLDQLGNGDVLIYNNTNMLLKMDNEDRFNIWINDKALGQLRANEYIIVNLEEGNHQLKVHRGNIVTLKSSHDFEVDSNTKIVGISPIFVTNRLIRKNELPTQFEKFTYAKK